MRSLLHAAGALAVGCVALDALILWRHAWADWTLFSFLHLAWTLGFMLGTVLNVGFLETLGGRPLKSLGGPNTLTLARGMLVPPLLYLIARGDGLLACPGYLLIILTDVVDGWWARHGGGRSKLGIILDPVVDLLLHLGVFVTLSLTGWLGRAALVLIAARSLLLVGGAGLLYLWKGRVRIQPTPFGKATGFLLGVATVTLLVLVGPLSGEAPGLLRVLQNLVTTLLGLSVLHALAIGIINLARPPAPPTPLDRRWRWRDQGGPPEGPR